ncbi:hypothetical protein [Glaciihabitans sp. dw_435]|uniref:hypothetical protein n=1 Tax=Glaciihabitans sp. dw_435 TaxID=2720081 RepID=UPI001BD41F69|nr:hypothetical protein [Glaciihabitans sp. dw_435]
MKFVIASGKVDIGWGVTEAAASTANADEAGHPWTLAKGTHSRNVGKRQLWYQIWSSPGEVKSHGWTCVLAGG